jgi:hypothetical protein
MLDGDGGTLHTLSRSKVQVTYSILTYWFDFAHSQKELNSAHWDRKTLSVVTYHFSL